MERLFNLIPAILLLTILFGCKMDDAPMVGVLIAKGIDITLQDSSGNDLLSSTHPNRIDPSKVKIYYINNGELVEVFDGRLDYPRNFFVFENEEENINEMRLFLGGDRPIGETVIHWGNYEADTIRAEFEGLGDSGRSGIVLLRAWHKEELVFDVETSDTRSRFLMVK